MWLEVLIAVAVLGFALLIRQFEESSREFKKPFMIIVAVFLIIYICASLFLGYRITNIQAFINQNPAEKSTDIKVIDHEIVPVDLSTEN
ncbi:MAG: hypothetical protein ACOYUZ_00375 [Patescibacteria group bacterium]